MFVHFLSEIINRLVDDLKDENEQYRKMVMESIEKIMGGLGAADIDSRLEEQLIDGILYAFQEQVHTKYMILPQLIKHNFGPTHETHC